MLKRERVHKVLKRERVHELVTGLQQHYGDNYEVSISFGSNSARFCQFAGGVDIDIVCKDDTKVTSAALLVQVEEQEETGEEQQERLQHTPPKTSETRSGIIEGKVSHSQQSDEEVTTS